MFCEKETLQFAKVCKAKKKHSNEESAQSNFVITSDNSDYYYLIGQGFIK